MKHWFGDSFYVIQVRQQYDYLISQIGNADQTPVFFDMAWNTTIDATGLNSVLVKTTGAEKLRCTVMLCVAADGNKLPPYVIFKRKTLPKETIPDGIHLRVQEKGWMTAELMEEDLEKTTRGIITKEVPSCPRQFPGGLTSIL